MQCVSFQFIWFNILLFLVRPFQTPMAFYPTWQADPSQGWQNQFIQQIPQNTPGISALNSIDFQPQVRVFWMIHAICFFLSFLFCNALWLTLMSRYANVWFHRHHHHRHHYNRHSNDFRFIYFHSFQGYAAYQPTGYVQSGLGFDPNYGRTYATPVQRYDFQSNQIPPINQVSLQSVSFAPTATYAGQVTTGPSPMLLGGQNDLNKCECMEMVRI